MCSAPLRIMIVDGKWPSCSRLACLLLSTGCRADRATRYYISTVQCTIKWVPSLRKQTGRRKRSARLGALFTDVNGSKESAHDYIEQIVFV